MIRLHWAFIVSLYIGMVIGHILWGYSTELDWRIFERCFFQGWALLTVVVVAILLSHLSRNQRDDKTPSSGIKEMTRPLVTAIHEACKGLPIGRGSLLQKIDELLAQVKSEPWTLGFHDRGLGHGDWGVIHEGLDALIVQCDYKEIAQHIIDLHNKELE